MHKGDQVTLTRSSWWQQQLVPRRPREDLVVMALLHSLLEIRQRQPARRQEQQSQQKTKGMKGAAQSLGEQNHLEVFVPFTRALGCHGSTRGCVTRGERSLLGGKGIYLPCSVQPGSCMAPSPAFYPACTASSPHQWISWWEICLPAPWWWCQGPALWLCPSLSTPNSTQKLCAVIYSSSPCQEIAFHKVSGIFKEQSNSFLQDAAATSWARTQRPSPAGRQGAQSIDVLTWSREKKTFCVLLNCLELSFSQQIQRIGDNMHKTVLNRDKRSMDSMLSPSRVHQAAAFWQHPGPIT